MVISVPILIFLIGFVHCNEAVVVPSIKLSDGRDIPAVALGTWLGNNTQGRIEPGYDEVEKAVSWAIESGYRHIDTAYMYRTEDQIGRAIKKKIEQGMKREEFFVTTKMASNNWNNYYIVEFLDPPYVGFDKFVCIPEAWVLEHDLKTGLVFLKYPIEKASKLKQRIKDGNVSSIDWSIYKANCKLTAATYKHAEWYIEIMEQNYLELRKRGDDKNLSSGATIRIRPQVQVKRDKYNRDSTGITSKIGFNFHPREVTANLTDEITKQTPTLSESLKEEHSGVSNKHIWDEYQKNVEKNPKVYYFSKCLTQDDTRSDKSNKSFENDMADLAASVKSISMYNSAEDFDSVATTSKGTVVEEEREREEEIEEDRQVAKETQTGVSKNKEAQSDDKEDNEDIDDISETSLNETLLDDLPPEYNKYDSKWTLRYREPSEGLVELMEGSNVFVNAAKLISFQRTASSARDIKTLAQLLVFEIFTETALSTCEFSADNYYRRSTMSSSPELDKYATRVLLTYIEQYARDHTWPYFFKDDILSSVSLKIHKWKKNRK